MIDLVLVAQPAQHPDVRGLLPAPGRGQNLVHVRAVRIVGAPQLLLKVKSLVRLPDPVLEHHTVNVQIRLVVPIQKLQSFLEEVAKKEMKKNQGHNPLIFK